MYEDTTQHDKKCIQDFLSSTVSAGYVYMYTAGKERQFSSLLFVTRTYKSKKHFHYTNQK